MAKEQIDFTKPQRIIYPVYREALRAHKPSEWAALGFCLQPDGSRHPRYYINLKDLLTWGAGLDEMRRRGYDAQAAEEYLWSVYDRYVDDIYEYFEDVQEGQLPERVRAFCEKNFPESWPFK